MPQIFSRLTAGPVEQMLANDPEIFPNLATAELASSQLDNFRKQRSSALWKEYPILPFDMDGYAGLLNLKMARPQTSVILGNGKGAYLNAIRLEFPTFTIIESQEKKEKGEVERRLIIGTNVEATHSFIHSVIGEKASALLDLPRILENIFADWRIESGDTRGIGTAFEFMPISA